MSFRHVPLQESPAPEKVSSNRRATVRYHCAPATPGRVVLAEKLEMQRAWVLDLSLGGVGLLLGRPLAPGQHVVIRLKATGSEKVHELSAGVVHATREPGGEYVVGCRLDTRLTAEELEALL